MVAALICCCLCPGPVIECESGKDEKQQTGKKNELDQVSSHCETPGFIRMIQECQYLLLQLHQQRLQLINMYRAALDDLHNCSFCSSSDPTGHDNQTQTFAKKKIAGIEERFMCHALCLSIIIIYIIQQVSASHNYNTYILVYLTYF